MLLDQRKGNDSTFFTFFNGVLFFFVIDFDIFHTAGNIKPLQANCLQVNADLLPVLVERFIYEILIHDIKALTQFKDPLGDFKLQGLNVFNLPIDQQVVKLGFQRPERLAVCRFKFDNVAILLDGLQNRSAYHL